MRFVMCLEAKEKGQVKEEALCAVSTRGSLSETVESEVRQYMCIVYMYLLSVL